MKKHDFLFQTPSDRWDEGLPLGNGGMGALLFGDGNPLRIALDRTDIWDNTPNPLTLRKDFTYAELIKLVRGGRENQAEILRRFDDIYLTPTPTKLPVGGFSLTLKQKFVRAKLELSRAVAEIEFENEVKIFAFVHSLKPLFVLRVENAQPKLKLCPCDLSSIGWSSAQKVQKERVLIFEQTGKENQSFAVLVGKREFCGGVLFLASVATGEEIESRTELLERELDLDYVEHLSGHAKDWKKFWRKTAAIKIPDSTLERVWYRNSYLLNSCSRRGGYPMPLQGVWTAADGGLPPWKGDYHHDLNTQMSYQSYMKANQLDNGACFCEYLWNLRDVGKAFAKSFFDCPDGLLFPTVMTAAGTPLGGWPQYSLNIVNNIWLCKAFEDYYRYAPDETFLKERAYPFFELVAKGVTRWLEIGEDGFYALPLSSSPEVFDNRFEAWQSPNTANDLALLRYLFQTLTEFGETLGRETGIWKEYLDRLAPLPVDGEGLLMNAKQRLPESHRHLGHLMAIYPLKQISYASEEEKQIVDNSIRHLEELGSGFWCCFTYGWIANLYAIQGNGNAAWYALRTFCDYYLSRNNFNLNFDYRNYGVTSWHQGRPFTLESNFGFSDALQNMLLSDREEELVLFPALPEDFRGTASFSRFLARGGVTVSATIREGKLKTLTLSAPRPVRMKIRNNFGKTEFFVNGKIVSCGEYLEVCVGKDPVRIK